MKDKFNICIITHPFSSEVVGRSILFNFINSLVRSSNKVFVITGITMDGIMREDITFINVSCSKKPLIISIIRYVMAQIKISVYLISMHKKIDLVILFLNNTTVLPTIVAKLLGIRIITIVTGSSSKVAKERQAIYKHTSKYFSRIIQLFEDINYTLSDNIVVYSQNIINEYNLSKYDKKIIQSYEHFINFNNFKILTSFNKRDNIVGYVGRLSEEKGIMHFVRSIPIVLKEDPDINFFIVGNGLLWDDIIHELKKSGITDHVKMIGLIPHDNIPVYLNQMKLLVLPSFTEGLPNVIIESMACGTPTLATPVGSIPDIIADTKNGYLLKNNKPGHIAKCILDALHDTNIDMISNNAEKYVKEHFTFENAVENNKKIVNDIMAT